MISTLIICLLLALLISGIPIFAALMLTGSAIMLIADGSVDSLAATVFTDLNKPILLAVPLFVLMAQLMIKSGAVDDLFDFANAIVGNVRGGVGVATVLSCAILASISGSSIATALSVGQTAIPQMRKYGYSETSALGVTAAGGTLGILIPPSGPMILYAIVANASIGALFLAGIVPGLLLAIAFGVYCMFREGRDKHTQRQPFSGWQSVAVKLSRSKWAVMMPPLIFGGIYGGIFTATEAAAVGCLYAFVVGAVIYRKIGPRVLWVCLWQTMLTSCMVFAIMAGASVFSHAVTAIRLPYSISEWIVSMDLSVIMFLALVMFIIFAMGMFMDAVAIILITTPILLPSMIALDINPVWYGVLLMINLELAMITPPVGMNLFVIKGITGSSLSAVVQGAAPYVLIMLLALLVIALVPGLATWLPTSAGYRF